MPSELTLDRTDPGIDSMVADWANGEEYELRVKVRQTSTDPKSAKFEVIEAVDENGDAPEDEAPAEGEGEYPAEKPKGKPPGKMMGKPALTISFGHR